MSIKNEIFSDSSKEQSLFTNRWSHFAKYLGF